MAEQIEILDIVCEVCGISPNELYARTKRRDVVMARHIIGYVLYTHFNYKIRDIARIIGTGTTAPYRFLFDKPIKRRSHEDELLNDRLHIVEQIIKEKIKKNKSFH